MELNNLVIRSVESVDKLKVKLANYSLVGEVDEDNYPSVNLEYFSDLSFVCGDKIKLELNKSDEGNWELLDQSIDPGEPYSSVTLINKSNKSFYEKVYIWVNKNALGILNLTDKYDIKLTKT